MSSIPSFEDQTLRAVCDVLGDTATGLTGSELRRILSDCGIADPSPTSTKRHRLYDALAQRQLRDGCGNNVASFILTAMNPVRYVDNAALFDERRASLNQVLSFAGLAVSDDGKLKTVQAARSLADARERAGHLRARLQQRGVHPDVLRFCRAELLQENYFHAVFEAAKSVADKMREKSGLTSDGTQLIDGAFGFSPGALPILAFNSLRTETEQSEHRGLMNLLKGLFGTFRNTLAHAPRIKWVIDEQDALDMLSLASLLHRRLDRAVQTRA